MATFLRKQISSFRHNESIRSIGVNIENTLLLVGDVFHVLARVEEEDDDEEEEDDDDFCCGAGPGWAGDDEWNAWANGRSGPVPSFCWMTGAAVWALLSRARP